MLSIKGLPICPQSLPLITDIADSRGWGRSVTKPSEKGLTGPTATVMADITSILSTVIPTRPVPSAPVFLYGHSMGGQEVLMYAATGPANMRQHIRGYLLEAPFIAIHPKSRPNAFTIMAGRLAGRILPRYHMYNPLDPKLLSRDPEVGKAVADDPLCHDTGTLEGLAAMLDRAADLENGKVKIGNDAGEGGKTRIWISHGTEDMVCDFHATKKVYESLDPSIEDKEFKVYEGWYHMREFHSIALPGIARPNTDNMDSAQGQARRQSDICKRCGQLDISKVRSRYRAQVEIMMS